MYLIVFLFPSVGYSRSQIQSHTPLKARAKQCTGKYVHTHTHTRIQKYIHIYIIHTNIHSSCRPVWLRVWPSILSFIRRCLCFYVESHMLHSKSAFMWQYIEHTDTKKFICQCWKIKLSSKKSQFPKKEKKKKRPFEHYSTYSLTFQKKHMARHSIRELVIVSWDQVLSYDTPSV